MPIGTLNSNNGLSKRMDQILGTDPMNPIMNDLTVHNLKVTGTVSGVSLSSGGSGSVSTSNENFTGKLEGQVIGTQNDTQIADDVIDTRNIVNSAITREKLSDDINALLDKIESLELAPTEETPKEDVVVEDVAAEDAAAEDGSRAVTISSYKAASVVADNSVTTAKIVSKAVTTAKLADKAVTSAQLADNAVTTAKLGDKVVTSAQLADKAVTSAQLADKAVTTAQLADKAVTSAQLADKAVTSAQLADNSVTSAQLADKSVTSAELADKAVTAAKIADKTITAAQLADGVIPSALTVTADAITSAIKSTSLPSLRFDVVPNFDNLNMDEFSRTAVNAITLTSEPVNKNVQTFAAATRFVEYPNGITTLTTAYTDVGNPIEINYTSYNPAPATASPSFYGIVVNPTIATGTAAARAVNPPSRIFTSSKFTNVRIFNNVYRAPVSESASPTSFTAPSNITFTWGATTANTVAGKTGAFAIGDHVISADNRLFYFKTATEVAQVDLTGLDGVILEVRAPAGTTAFTTLCTYNELNGIRQYVAVAADNFDAVADPANGTVTDGSSYKMYIPNTSINAEPIIGTYGLVAGNRTAVLNSNLTIDGTNQGNDTFALATTGNYTWNVAGQTNTNFIGRVLASAPGKLVKLTESASTTTFQSGTVTYTPLTANGFVVDGANADGTGTGQVTSTTELTTASALLNNVLFRINGYTIVREISKIVAWDNRIRSVSNVGVLSAVVANGAAAVYRTDVTKSPASLIQISAAGAAAPESLSSPYSPIADGLYIVNGKIQYYVDGLISVASKLSKGTYLSSDSVSIVTVSDDAGSVAITTISTDAISLGFPRSIRTKANAGAAYAYPGVTADSIFLDFENRKAYRGTGTFTAHAVVGATAASINRYNPLAPGNYSFTAVTNGRAVAAGLDAAAYAGMVITVTDTSGSFVPMGTGEANPYTILFNTTTSLYQQITSSATAPLLNTAANIGAALSAVWGNRIRTFAAGVINTSIAPGWYASQSNLYYVDNGNTTGALVSKNPSVNGKEVDRVYVNQSDLVYSKGQTVNYTNGDVIAVNNLGLRVFFSEVGGFRPAVTA